MSEIMTFAEIKHNYDGEWQGKRILIFPEIWYNQGLL